LVLYLGWFAGLVGVLVASVLSVYTIAAIFVLFVSLAVVAAPLLAPIRARAWMMAVAVILVTALVGVSAFGAARSFAASRQVALAQTGDTKLRLEEAIRLTPWDARTRFNYLWRKAGATQPVLTGPDAAMARAASDALDTEIKLAILDFPHELLLYRMRMDLYAGSQGYPGYQPDKHLEAIDAALAVFPNDVEFTDRRQALEGAAN
jgi:hypothetical protein